MCVCVCVCMLVNVCVCQGLPLGLTGSPIGHPSIVYGFKPWPGYIIKMFHISLRLITFKGRPANLAYLLHIYVLSVTDIDSLEYIRIIIKGNTAIVLMVSFEIPSNKTN